MSWAQFVDSISTTPGVRLDLDGGTLRLQQADTDLGMPTLKYATASTLLVDGARIPAAAYDNRMLQIVVVPADPSPDSAASVLQALIREVNRAGNFLRWQPGTTAPVFFRTFRSEANTVGWDPLGKRFSLQVLAEPFAYGVREDLAGGFPVVISGDPAATVNGCYADLDFSSPLNADPGFETSGVPDWTGTGGTLTRDATQSHSGANSGKIVPDGVTATTKIEQAAFVAVTASGVYVASGWVRCDVARTVNINVAWYDAAQSLISTSTGALAVSATTWTQISNRFTAPTTAAYAKMQATMTGTPAASNVLRVDEVMLGPTAAIKGDVETPVVLAVDVSIITPIQGGEQTLTAIRRRGTPSALTHLLQAETMTAGTDTTIQANDAVMSGAGQNFMRTTFATATHIQRLAVVFPASPAPVDQRGTYRVYARLRQVSAGVNTYTMQLVWSVAGDILGDKITVSPSSTNPFLADLGLIGFPAGNDPVFDGYSGTAMQISGTNLYVYAGRSAGTSSLDIDCLLFIPADQEFCITSWVNTGFPVLDGPNDVAYGAANAVKVVQSGKSNTRAGRIPMLSPGQTNRLFWVRELNPTGSHSLSHTTPMVLSYYPRYLFVKPQST